MLFILLGLFNQVETKVFLLENKEVKSFSEEYFHKQTLEAKWFGLLYLQEGLTNQDQTLFLQFSSGSFSKNFSYRLCLKSTSENLESSSQIYENLESHPRNEKLEDNVSCQNPQLVKAWKKLDKLGADEALRRNPGALDALAKKTAGDEVPLPSTYLDAGYISNHLAKFDDGASYLVPKSVLDSRGRDLLGRPDGVFIIPKSEMDNLLSKTGGDIAKIETELGIPDGLWQGQELSRIDISDLSDLNKRMPTGNEVGANELWIPGGKTPAGYSEVVIDQIPKGKYVENPID